MPLFTPTANILLTDSDSQLAFLLSNLRQPHAQAQEALETMRHLYADQDRAGDWLRLVSLLPEVGRNAAALDWWFKLPVDEKLELIIWLCGEAG